MSPRKSFVYDLMLFENATVLRRSIVYVVGVLSSCMFTHQKLANVIASNGNKQGWNQGDSDVGRPYLYFIGWASNLQPIVFI